LSNDRSGGGASSAPDSSLVIAVIRPVSPVTTTLTPRAAIFLKKPSPQLPVVCQQLNR
jgi:hypothetical protein